VVDPGFAKIRVYNPKLGMDTYQYPKHQLVDVQVELVELVQENVTYYTHKMATKTK